MLLLQASPMAAQGAAGACTPQDVETPKYSYRARGQLPITNPGRGKGEALRNILLCGEVWGGPALQVNDLEFALSRSLP